MKAKTLKITLLASFAMVIFSCKENDDTWLVETTSDPITIEKVVDPTNYDAPVTGAVLEQLIKIVGENLANTASVFINDVEVEMPLYANVVNGVLYIRIPYIAPTVVDNKIKITDKYGNTAEIPDFIVTLPSMQGTGPAGTMEWVAPGGELTIAGDYFDLYRMTDSTGGIVQIGTQEAAILEMTKTTLTVTVPAGTAANSDITLISPTGETVVCKNRYRDGRWLLGDFNDKGFVTNGRWSYQGGTGNPSDPTDPTDPDPVDGVYLKYKASYPGGWNGDTWGVYRVNDSPNVPDDINSNRTAYNFKFEAWAGLPPGAVIRFEFEGEAPEVRFWWWGAISLSGDPALYPQAPALNQWQTVSVPAELIGPNPITKTFQMVAQGPDACEMYVAIDNPRFALK
jgi:hypothetical protein